MSSEQRMTRSIAAAIVDVVADDSACRAAIPEFSPFWIAQNAAGGLRNLVNMTAEGAAWLGEQWVNEAGRDDRFQLGTGRKPKPIGEVDTTSSSTAYAKEYWRRQGAAQDCVKIGDVTQAAINRAIKEGRLSEWVSKAWRADRNPAKDNHVALYHSATAVETADGMTYVFDWHATLSLRNPLISRSLVEWERGDDRYRVMFSVFQGWH